MFRHELISTSRNLISPDGTRPSWPVQQHCWHKTKQLPRPRLAQLITNRLRPVSLCKGRTETLAQTSISKNEGNSSAWANATRRNQSSRPRPTAPRTFWKCAGWRPPLNGSPWHFCDTGLNGQLTTHRHRETHTDGLQKGDACVDCDSFTEEELLCPRCDVIPWCGSCETIISQMDRSSILNSPTSHHFSQRTPPHARCLAGRDASFVEFQYFNGNRGGHQPLHHGSGIFGAHSSPHQRDVQR